MTSSVNKDIVVIVSLILSVVSLVLFSVTWYTQSSLQQQDRELLFKLQEQINTIVIHDDKMNDGDDYQRASHNGLTSPTSPLKKGTDGVQVQHDMMRSKRSNDRGDQEGTSSKREVVVYADNVETIQDNSNEGSVDECKGDKVGGSVYVRWGHDECPSTAQLVYSGRAGGPHYSDAGGGSNPQCLPLDPNYLTQINGSQYRAYMYGAEYRTHTDSDSPVHGRNNAEAPCAVCHVSNRTAVYMVPAKYTCPTGWTREYYGYPMAEYVHDHRSQFVCVDIALKQVPGSTPTNTGGWQLHFIEGRCGTLPCPPYDSTREFSCAVCTK